ncbi:UbiX family flavin prenyltransferase [Terriglobus roseus]|uniref:Flavin prenyltransferase UbiX n=1 Tax=Terriglobus roseus TaxID=392734 RepID=A0A1H4SEE5_9BACT|nr:UbiX family flavin prenyltransferase [Terriglobus roseus]SEC42201.1 4-hydroxy-3-polyprenylbenzoate decarboxylase [Terriglobus roseus]
MRPIIVGISGATGIAYGVRALSLLRDLGVETHLVISSGAKMTVHETGVTVAEVESLATHVHHHENLGATLSSGSFRTAGMMVMPCSMRSLAAIAHAAPYNLLTRAADVTLKERRRLVLLTREAPLNQAHLQNMLLATQMGAVIYPPVPALYSRPQSIEEMIDYTVMRVFDLFDIEAPVDLPRWAGMASLSTAAIARP